MRLPTHLPLSLPFDAVVLCRHNSFTYTDLRRDFLLTYEELLNYAKHIPDNNTLDVDGFFMIPAVEHIPQRYRMGCTMHDHNDNSSRAPFTPAAFYDYFRDLSVSNNHLISKSTGRRICTRRPWLTFRYYASILFDNDLVDANVSVEEFLEDVENIAEMSFIDGIVFAHHYVHNTELPSPMEFGLLGIDSWIPLNVEVVNF
ncbi:hypothetical protein VNI00_015613 [Paramarasmius palmivorus]|uniref:Uncharacterized protein n=1 Tax=Paramarasmius palmivorus TaxID=297713 RepID=A0AAW0BL32_9AGAR